MQPTKKLAALATTALLAFTLAPAVTSFADASSDQQSTTASIAFNKEETNPGEEGDLQLKSVPTLDFGSVDRNKTSDQAYTLTGADPQVDLVDGRGTAAGWSLSAKLGAIKGTNDAGTSGTLTAAQLYFNNGDVATTGVGTAPSGVSTSNMLTAGGDEVALMTAATGEGTGEWVQSWGADDVSLNVRQGTAMANASYSGTIDWKLSNSVTDSSTF
ncbi:WxL domain-containing protein [Furfurilactobacillus sp. WILCCON 0119]